MDPLKILLVDDHEGFRTACADFLSQLPDVKLIGQGKDGLEGVQLARSLEPDIVLMDISMPGMSGLEATRRIKQQSGKPMVVFVSVEEKTTYKALGVLLGIDGYVCKSHLEQDLPQVLEKLRGTVQKKRQRKTMHYNSKPDSSS